MLFFLIQKKYKNKSLKRQNKKPKKNQKKTKTKQKNTLESFYGFTKLYFGNIYSNLDYCTNYIISFIVLIIYLNKSF